MRRLILVAVWWWLACLGCAHGPQVPVQTSDGWCVGIEDTTEVLP